MEDVKKLMHKYFKNESLYTNALIDIFEKICIKWSKSDTDKKINLLTEDNEEQAFILEYYSDEAIYPQKIELEFLDDKNYYLSLYAKNDFSSDEFILDEKDWISNNDLIGFLIEAIAVHLGYDLDSED